MSKTTITARMRADGTIVEVASDGSERPFPDMPMREMTEAEIEAGAAADPDARPMTPEELTKARSVPRVKTLRRALGLTQQEFAARYHIPLGTLRDWEQGHTEPDQPARAYLTVIAHDPEGARRALRSKGLLPEHGLDRVGLRLISEWLEAHHPLLLCAKTWPARSFPGSRPRAGSRAIGA